MPVWFFVLEGVSTIAFCWTWNTTFGTDQEARYRALRQSSHDRDIR